MKNLRYHFPTCTEPQVVCIAVCASGCECPVGTLFDEKTRACVLPMQCPQKCKLLCETTVLIL